MSKGFSPVFMQHDEVESILAGLFIQINLQNSEYTLQLLDKTYHDQAHS